MSYLSHGARRRRRSVRPSSCIVMVALTICWLFAFYWIVLLVGWLL